MIYIAKGKVKKNKTKRKTKLWKSGKTLLERKNKVQKLKEHIKKCICETSQATH